MRGCFVTSSGTEIGKTLVVCALVRALRRQAVPVHAVKPVITGFSAATAGGSDTARILAALNLPMTGDNVAAVSKWRFEAPLSPDMAAAREGRVIDTGEVASFCRGAAPAGMETETVLVVEGIGGVMAPLNGADTVLDVMAALGLPAVLVVGSYLGALSHSLSAAAALAGRGIDLAAMVVSESAESPAPLAETMETLIRFAAPAPVIPLPRGPGDGDGDHAHAMAADLISALGLSAPAHPGEKASVCFI